MSYGLLANPPITLLPVFSEASFDYSTSSTSTIDTELLQAQTDEIYTDASAQSIVLANIGQILNVSSASGSGTIGTNSTYTSSVLANGSYYAISIAFNFYQTGSIYTINALTLQDNFGNIYDAGKGATGTSVKSCSIVFDTLLVGNGNPFTLTIYSQATTNGGAYTYNIQTNILKIK
jgi:hypothetical protein